MSEDKFISQYFFGTCYLQYSLNKFGFDANFCSVGTIM